MHSTGWYSQVGGHASQEVRHKKTFQRLSGNILDKMSGGIDERKSLRGHLTDLKEAPEKRVEMSREWITQELTNTTHTACTKVFGVNYYELFHISEISRDIQQSQTPKRRNMARSSKGSRGLVPVAIPKYIRAWPF